MNARDAWRATLGQLQVQLNRATYDTWLRHAELLAYEDGRFVVSVPNAYAKDWIDRHLLVSMTQTLSRIFRREAEIQIIVWNPIEDEPGELFAPAEPPHMADRTNRVDTVTERLNSAYRLDRFIVGTSNRYAYLLAKSVTESAVGTFSTVLFFGSMGLGKTHLLQAITRELRDAGYDALYVTCEDFTNELVTAIRGGIGAFRDKYRAVDVLLLDDAQFLEGKDSTQNELVAIWDTLRTRHKTMVLSSTVLPRDMKRMSRDAVSRFQAGPIALIDAPDESLRRDLIEAKCEQHRLRLPDDVTELLVEQVTTSVRDLESAIEQLKTHTHLTREPITYASAQRTLGSYMGRASADTITNTSLERVVQAVADHFGVTLDDLRGRKRTKAAASARQLAMYMARELTDSSLSQIGSALGGRDHSTVLHGCARVAELLHTDDQIRDAAEAVRAKMAGIRSTTKWF